MNVLHALLKRVACHFDERGQRWALIGGLAVSVRSEPRFTRDLDLAVAVPDDSAAESLICDLQREGFQAFATVEQEATGRLATARLSFGGDASMGIVVDLLFASSGIESDICDAAGKSGWLRRDLRGGECE